MNLHPVQWLTIAIAMLGAGMIGYGLGMHPQDGACLPQYGSDYARGYGDGFQAGALRPEATR